MAVGMSLYELGRDEEAVAHLERAAAIRNRLGDRVGEANCWHGVAHARHRQGRAADATAAAEKALAQARASGDDAHVRRATEGLAALSGAAAPVPPAAPPPPPAPAARPPGPDRRAAFRVFVSSTFRDMHAEREDLVKRVFPELRRRCADRGVAFTEVDLRWGITEAQAERGEVLPVCLAEVERCRPFFLGVLGERYGWVPDGFADELVGRYPWLAGLRGRSVTELEVLHGVLNEPAAARGAFFYFRDPAHGNAPRADDVDPARLADLKARIRTCGRPVREGYAGPEAFGEMVLADLTAAVDAAFPPEPLHPLDGAAADHAAFAAARTAAYVGRPAYYDRLDDHAGRAGPPLVVVGEPGAGKSALLANWAEHYRAARPGDLVLTHFVGAGAVSADWGTMLARLLAEFNRRLGLDLPPPDSPAAVGPAFARGLAAAAARAGRTGGRVVLVLDGLDQLDDWGGGPDLLWLPESLPAPVRVVASALPGRALDELGRGGCPTLTVEPLTPDERRAVTAEYLGQYSKRLRADRLERIATAPPSANPLYLRALLEELRVWGVHERIDERIGHYLAAPTAADLFRRILERYEADYERDRPGLVGDALSLLWAARRGLTEAELLDLLGSDGRPPPRAVWSPLFLAAAAGLVERAGLLGFFHEHLRRAVREKYVPDPAAAHRRLADYFARAALDRRKIDELPWQLSRAGEWGRLHDALRDPAFFPVVAAADEAGFRRYWAELERNGGYQMADAYRDLIDRPGDHPGAAEAVGMLLNLTGRWDECVRLGGGLIEHHRRAGADGPLALALDNQANLLVRRGKLADAAALLEEKGRLLERSGDDRGREMWLGTMAMLTWERGDPAETWRLLGEQEAILRRLGDRRRLGGCLIQKSFVLHARRRHEEAIDLLREPLRLAQAADDPDGLQAVYGEMAVNHLSLGRHDQARQLFERQAELCRQLGDPESLAGCLGNLGNVYAGRREWGRALELFGEMERIGQAIGHGRIEHVGRSSRAMAHCGAGEVDRAEESIRGVPEFFEAAGMVEPLGIALRTAARIRTARGDVVGGLRLQARADDVAGPRPFEPRLTAEQVDRFAAMSQDPAAVLEAARRRAAAEPDSAEVRAALGDALARARLPVEAVAAYRRALALRPGWADVEVKLADLILSQEFDR